MIELDRLDDRARAEVMAAVTAVETAEAPVPAGAYVGLGDGALRAMVEEILSAGGRSLIPCGEDGWLSAYRDEIADELMAAGLARLDEADRAVLALVLLHTVAIPRATGEIDSADWTVAKPVSRRTLHLSRALHNKTIDESLRRLQARGILRRGHRADIVPGPQFLRLSETRSRQLWEDLVLLCKPHGAQAAQIRRRRAAELQAAHTDTEVVA
jgi:hypothetical protein